MTTVVMLTNVVAPDKLGGLERYVYELSGQLVKAGIKVTVVSKRTAEDQPGEEVADDGVHIIRYSPPTKRDPLFALKYPFVISASVARSIRRTVGEAQDDRLIIHGHFPVPMLPILLRRQRFIYTFHAPVYKEIASERQGSYHLSPVAERIGIWGMRQVEAWIMHRATRVITLSQFVRGEAHTLSTAADKRAVLIPGGIDLDRFHPAAGLGAFVGEFGASEIIFCARRMVARTGVEELIDAAAIILPERPGLHFAIAGGGPRRAAIEASIARHGIGDRVHLLGWVSDDDLVRWYQSATIAVTPTQELEGFGLSTAEALACGAIPVVTPVGANAEVVDGLPSDLVTSDRTPEAIAASLLAVLTNLDTTDGIRSAVRSTAADRFGWPAVIAQYLDLYASLDPDVLSSR